MATILVRLKFIILLGFLYNFFFFFENLSIQFGGGASRRKRRERAFLYRKSFFVRFSKKGKVCVCVAQKDNENIFKI